MKWRQFISFSFLVLLLDMAPTALASNAWYVYDGLGSDGNNCLSWQDACATIGHAISLASSGDSIIVAPGGYPEHLTIGKSLTILGSGATTTIIQIPNFVMQNVVTISSATTVTLSGFTIRNGTSPFGGGIRNGGTLTINNCTLTGNKAVFTRLTGGGSGGGILNSGTLTINNSTLSGNRADRVGGGIANGGALTINNSTISGNSAVDPSLVDPPFGYGGGIYNNGGRLTINNGTLNGNSARISGGSIYNAATATLQNSIVASSPSGGNCGGTVSSNGYNLSSDGTCNFNRPGDLNNHDPLLGPLQNNGGPTHTMALLPGSPAIDGGNPSGCTDGQGNLFKTDQRGMPRPDQEDSVGCDMGAYESQSD